MAHLISDHIHSIVVLQQLKIIMALCVRCSNNSKTIEKFAARGWGLELIDNMHIFCITCGICGIGVMNGDEIDPVFNQRGGYYHDKCCGNVSGGMSADEFRIKNGTLDVPSELIQPDHVIVCKGCKKSFNYDHGDGRCYDCVKCKGCMKTAGENGHLFPHYNGYCKHCAKCNGCMKTAGENGGKYPIHDGNCYNCAKCKGCMKTASDNGNKYPKFDGKCYHCVKCNGCMKTASENGGFFPKFDGYCYHCVKCNGCMKTVSENGGLAPTHYGGNCYYCIKRK